jgi:hypothetical protein
MGKNMSIKNCNTLKSFIERNMKKKLGRTSEGEQKRHQKLDISCIVVAKHDMSNIPQVSRRAFCTVMTF